MHLFTLRQFYLLFHLATGIVMLHAIVEIVWWLLRPERIRRASYAVATIAALAWMTVISGTWMIYIGYRAKPAAGADLMNYPKEYLLAHDSLALWHTFGMEWKEHVAWLVPILTTVMAFVMFRYGSRVTSDRTTRYVTIGYLSVAIIGSLVAATFGAIITKVAPNTFLGM
jgi:hypothetical protein